MAACFLCEGESAAGSSPDAGEAYRFGPTRKSLLKRGMAAGRCVKFSVILAEKVAPRSPLERLRDIAREPSRLGGSAMYRTVICTALAAGLTLGLSNEASAGEELRFDGVPHRISGPYRHANLALYLVHGPDRLEDLALTPIDEALSAGIALVHETGVVGELQVENTSKDRTVFIQAGDIVRGGRQDRIFGADLLLPPGSGKVPIASFCVESGRWQARSPGGARIFVSADNFAVSSELKRASRGAGSQSAVWSEVSAIQDKLSSSARMEVRDPTSATSLELSLASGPVKDSSDAYLRALEKSVADAPDALGFVFAINGRVSGGEVYASHALLARLWPKMLRAAAVEALAERGATAAAPAEEASADKIRAFLREGAPLPAGKRLNAQTRYAVVDGAETLISLTSSEGKGWVHRSYVKK
jgi:hypothetical protein